MRKGLNDALRAAAVLTGLLCSGAPPVEAQGPLAAAKALRCTFARVAVSAWNTAGAPAAGVKPATLTLRFESVDADSGTAQLRNGALGSEITVRIAEGYLHFMQAFRTGPLYTTTVFEAGARGGRFKAVHSRHELFSTPLPGATSSPEQYYGECEVLK